MKRSLEDIIRGLLEYENRPKEVGSTELLLVVWLVTKGAIETPVRASRTTLGMALGTSDVTVWRAVKNLIADGGVGWIELRSGKGRGNASLYSVLLDRLPVPEQIKRTIVSKQATETAARYCLTAAYSQVTFKKRRFTQANRQRIAFCFQQFLDKHCAGDLRLLRDTLNHARTSPRYRAKYYRGPHELRRDFSAIVQECRAVQTPAPAQPLATPARVSAEQSATFEEAARRQASDRAA